MHSLGILQHLPILIPCNSPVLSRVYAVFFPIYKSSATSSTVSISFSQSYIIKQNAIYEITPGECPSFARDVFGGYNYVCWDAGFIFSGYEHSPYWQQIEVQPESCHAIGLCELFDFCVFHGWERTIDVLSADRFISRHLEVVRLTFRKSCFRKAYRAVSFHGCNLCILS